MTMLSNPDLLLGRRDAAKLLQDLGYATTYASLCTYATRGCGPLFRKYGHRCLYRAEDLVSWAEGRLSEPVASTAELRGAA